MKGNGKEDGKGMRRNERRREGEEEDKRERTRTIESLRNINN